MGLSISSLNINPDPTYRSVATTPPNRAEISSGLYTMPSASPLYPSSTAFGTTANDAVPGTYIPSSVETSQLYNASLNSNVVTTKNLVEDGNQLKQALNKIAENTPRFSPEKNVFSVNTQPTVTQSPSPIHTSSNITTTSNVLDIKLSLTGSNAMISHNAATNMAAVNANYNVNLSDQASQAIKSLQNTATLGMMQNNNITAKMDGMMPIAPSTLTSFVPTSSGNANMNPFNYLTEAFNNILEGGGHGGGGGNMSSNTHTGKEENPQQRHKKGIHFMA